MADAAGNGVGRRSALLAGSGKSLDRRPRSGDTTVFDSIIVGPGSTWGQYAQVGATVARAQQSGDRRRFIEAGKKIIISTVQKFPFILDEIGNEQRTRRFAILIDEAHSSQGGRTSSSISVALGTAGEEAEEETCEDRINRVMASRRLLPNASYFAFTATPKNKTLEIFGAPDPQPDGAVRHRAFHSYTMKQAIQEGFILDVLAHYTPVASYYRLAKTVEDDPEFDFRKAQKKLRRLVEGHDHAIRLKAEIMVDHFREQVIARNKIGGAARAMVVTNGIERAIQYFHAIRDYLQQRKSPYRAVVAFSGEPEFGGRKVTEASLNGFPSGRIARKIREDPHRFLVCADKFQTGYDEPLLHTMYVDKTLSGIKAVQTLSRLNRAHPEEARRLRARFPERRRHHPRRLRRLLPRDDPGRRDRPRQAPRPAGGPRRRPSLLTRAGRRRRPPLSRRGRARPARSDLRRLRGGLRARAGRGRAGRLQGQGQGVRADLRLPVVRPALHERRVGEALDLPELRDLQTTGARRRGPVQGHPRRIDMDSYRVEKRAVQKIMLPDEDAEIEPVPTSGVGQHPEPELDRLSNILEAFNDLFGDVAWEDRDRVGELITKTIPARVAADSAFRNARQNCDDANARIEHDKVLARVVTGMVKDDAELFKQFMDNEGFKRWMTDRVFELACAQPARRRGSGATRSRWSHGWKRGGKRRAWNGRPNVPLTDSEFAAILEDESKHVRGDIVWREDEDHSPALEFRVDVESTNGWPLLLKGRYNPVAGTLTYALILKTSGRVYGLDLGKDHHNPSCERVGEKHKHRWSERYGDKETYAPADLSAPVSDPVGCGGSSAPGHAFGMMAA